MIMWVIVENLLIFMHFVFDIYFVGHKVCDENSKIDSNVEYYYIKFNERLVNI